MKDLEITPHPLDPDFEFETMGQGKLARITRWNINLCDKGLMDDVSEAVIGLTIVAIGTSIPEVVTSIVATLKGQRDIAVGNVIGSNVFNLLAVLGVSGLIAPSGLIANSQLINLDLPVMLSVALLCMPLLYTGATLSRLEGMLFFALYFLYTWYLIGVALQLSYHVFLGQLALYGAIPLTLLLVIGSLIRAIRIRNK